MTLEAFSILILGLCITSCLIAIGVMDLRTRLIRNKSLLVLLGPVVLLILIAHRFSLYGFYGFAALLLLSLLLLATNQWGAGDSKLVAVLALLILVMPSGMQIWEAIYAFISLLCLGLGATYVVAKIAKVPSGAIPGGFTFILPGTALWVVLLLAYR